MLKKYNVLVFPCGTEIANEIIQSLRLNKYFSLLFASSEEVSYCAYRGKTIDFLPYVTDPTFENMLRSLIEEKQIDFIIPAHDDVAFALSELEEYIPAKIIGQSRKVNEIVRFKDVTYDYFQGLLPLAGIYHEKPDEAEFPVFVKPKKGQGSQNSVQLKTPEAFDAFFGDHPLLDFVIMELLPGEEFTIDCFSDKGKVLYFGARTREKMTRGISVQSTAICDSELENIFEAHAKTISQKLSLHGIWFFQMKYDKNKELRLLEIGPRVAGTMMLNRAKGVNFIELSLYQKLGYPVEVIKNDFSISLARALVPRYMHNMQYDHVYIDFDDTLLIDEAFINPDIMKLIFQSKNEQKYIYLITKNKKFNLVKSLHKFGITNIFDDIIHIHESEQKIDFMKPNSILIDDSFHERKEAISAGFYALGVDNIDVLFKDTI